MNDSVRDQILAMHEADQALRLPLIDAIRKAGNAPLPDWERTVERMQRLDEAHSVAVARLLREHGWLGASSIGDDAAYALNHLIAHRVSVDVVDLAIPLLRRAVEDGDASPVTLAEAEDRSDVAHGRPQHFGTQWQQVDDRPFEPFPMDGSPDDVDARRAAIGLPSLADHLKLLGETYSS